MINLKESGTAVPDVQMFKYILTFVCLAISFSGCGAFKKEIKDPNVKVFYPETEVIVTYNNEEVHRVSKYISLNKLKEIMTENKEFIIIFSSEKCSACILTHKAIKQAKLKTEVYYLNLDEKWVMQVASLMGIDSVPLMLHIDKKGNTIAQKLGPGQIVTYLLVRF